MKYLILFILCLVLAVWIGLALHHEPGMVVISVAGWRIDTPLWVGILIMLVTFLILYYGIRLISALMQGTHFFSSLLTSWRNWRAKRQTQKGLVALMERQWAKAERLLSKSAEKSYMPSLNYLCAAKAAQELGKENKRDEYLERARQRMPEAEIGVSLAQAQLQMGHQEYLQSLETLTALQKKSPHHPSILILMSQALFQLNDWDALHNLLPKLKHQISNTDLKKLERMVFRGIWIVHRHDPIDQIEEIWKKMPKEFKFDEEIVHAYATALLAHGKPQEAEVALRDALKHNWSEKLVRLYGCLNHPNPTKLLHLAETWLNSHQTSPSLLLTLGRLCEQQQLWGKAQRYLEASLSLAPHPETYATLAALLEKMNKPELGAHFYKKGLLLAVTQVCS